MFLKQSDYTQVYSIRIVAIIIIIVFTNMYTNPYYNIILFKWKIAGVKLMISSNHALERFYSASIRSGKKINEKLVISVTIKERPSSSMPLVMTDVTIGQCQMRFRYVL